MYHMQVTTSFLVYDIIVLTLSWTAEWPSWFVSSQQPFLLVAPSFQWVSAQTILLAKYFACHFCLALFLKGCGEIKSCIAKRVLRIMHSRQQVFGKSYLLPRLPLLVQQTTSPARVSDGVHSCRDDLPSIHSGKWFKEQGVLEPARYGFKFILYRLLTVWPRTFY